MRAVHLSDLNLAARTLLAVPVMQRRDTIRDIFKAAHIADKYRKRTGRPHTWFGNGTISGACQRRAKAHSPDRCDPDYLACMGIVIRALLDRKLHDGL